MSYTWTVYGVSLAYFYAYFAFILMTLQGNEASSDNALSAQDIRTILAALLKNVYT